MKTYSVISAACLIVLFTACGAEPGKATEQTNEQLQENKEEMAEAKTEGSQEWKNERDEAVKELRNLREDLVSKREREQKRLADGIKDATKKAECEARIAELGNNIARVDAAIMRVETNTGGTDWQDVKRNARETVDSTQNWIQREAEKIDWKTDADADKDGH